MTANDKQLIKKARRLRDYQEVDKLIEFAETFDAREWLRYRSDYLYRQELVAAGYS